MSTKSVIFSNPDDVIDFVKIVEKYPFDIWKKRELLLTGNPVRYIGRRNRMWMKADTETKKWYTKTEFVKSQRMGRLCKRKYG